MNKLPWRASAFAQRVRMGRARVWLVVEGRVSDRSFYDRVLRAHKDLDEGDFDIRLAEQITIDGTAAGGKQHALSLYRHYSDTGDLRQRNSHGERLIAFALDADYDRVLNEAVDDAHVIYTMGTDVEADILVHGDVAQAAADAYSIPLRSTQAVLPSGIELAQKLADAWSEWVLLGLQSAACGVGTGAAASKISQINSGGYGPLDEDRAKAIRASFEARVDVAGKRAQLTVASATYVAHSKQGAAWRLVKGKWMAKYVCHLVESGLTGVPKEKISSDTVTKTCLSGLDLSAPWVDHYHRQVSDLLDHRRLTA